jgi:hypothetical protein
MAIAFVANRASSTVASPATEESITLATGGAITVGNFLVLFTAYNNSGTAGVDPEMVIAVSEDVTARPYYDSKGNYWFRLAKEIRSSGGANDGAVVDVWATRVTSPYDDGDTISLQWAFPTTGLAFLLLEYSGVRGISYSAVEPVTGSGNGTNIGGLTIDVSAGQALIGVAATETNVAISGDGDTTNGAWGAIANIVYNSGVDATSMTLSFQSKTPNADGNQTWTISKAGSSDWAAVAIVLDPFVDAPFDVVPGNPNEPCVAGPEILPITTVGLTFDTGTEYLFTHRIPPNDYGSQDYRVLTTFQATPSNTSGSLIQAHTYAFDVYRAGDELARDPIEVYNGALTGAGLGGAATVSGGMTEADALATPGGDHVILPSGNDYVDVLFDVSGLTQVYPNHRILRWGVSYLAWKDDSSPPTPGEGMKFEWRDDDADNGGGAAVGLGYWLVPNYLRDAQYETRWFGEANLAARGKGEIVFTEFGWGAPFTVNDLSHMDLGDQATRIRIYGGTGEDLLQTDVYLDHVFMVVELVPERRLASGMRRIVTSPLVTANTYPAGLDGVPVYTALNSNTVWTVPSDPEPYVLAVREALPASPSDYYAVRTEGGRSIAANEAVGPPFETRALIIDRPTLSPQPIVRKATLAKGRIAGTPIEMETIYPTVTALDWINGVIEGTFWPAYISDSPGNIPQVYSGADKTQVIRVDGGVQYDRIKLLVQPDEMTVDDLEITIEQSAVPIAAATITVADALASADLGFGWREISVPLDVAITPAAGSVTVTMSSSTGEMAPWYVALGYSMRTYSGYSPDPGDDYAVVLQCTLATPAVTLDTATTALFRPTERCLEETVGLPQVTITNGGSYDWISIERTVNGGISYQPVTLIEVDDGESPLSDVVYIDYSAPWDLPSGVIEYRVSGYRDADRIVVQSADVPWNAVAAAPGAAFGLATEYGLLAYIPNNGSGPLEIEWNPLNPVSIVALHGVDYQVALRAPEERGLAVSVTVLVDHLVNCDVEADEFSPEVVNPGPQAMTPTPFDQLRALNGSYVTLILPGGHTRRVILEVGDMTVTVSKGIYLADIKMTDARVETVEPFAPTNL